MWPRTDGVQPLVLPLRVERRKLARACLVQPQRTGTISSMPGMWIWTGYDDCRKLAGGFPQSRCHDRSRKSTCANLSALFYAGLKWIEDIGFCGYGEAPGCFGRVTDMTENCR